jgi:hypothetical protein
MQKDLVEFQNNRPFAIEVKSTLRVLPKKKNPEREIILGLTLSNARNEE